MTDWGSRIVQNGRPQLGVGQSIAPKDVPQVLGVKYEDYRGGLNTMAAPEQIPLNASPFVADMEVDRDGSLTPAAGTYASVGYNAANFTNAFIQASLDYQTRFVMLSPPTIWSGVNYQTLTPAAAGLAAATEPWCALSVAGILLFSNGTTKTYTRTFAGVVVDITAAAEIIAARTFTLQFGRVFAGATTPIAGTFQPLGMQWNGSSGLPSDWTGAGSGAELLIDAETDTNKIVAIRPLGFDILVILCRQGVWFGYPTGDDDRPADFRPRYNDLGCLLERAVAITPYGIAFLSDNGIALVSAQSAGILSMQVNTALLADAMDDPTVCTMAYFADRDQLIFSSGSQTWVYNFPGVGSDPMQGWWHRRTLVPTTYLSFLPSSSLTGVPPYVEALFSILYDAGTTSSSITPVLVGKIGPTSRVPKWRFPIPSRESLTDEFITHGFEIEYALKDAAHTVTITMQLVDSLGAYTGTAVTKTLPVTYTGATRTYKKVQFWKVSTGMAAGLEVQVNYNQYDASDSFLNINRVRQLVSSAGPSLAVLP